MKKILALGLGCVLTAAIFTGCGETPPAPPANQQETNAIKLGVITRLNVTETLMDNMVEDAKKQANITYPLHNAVFYNNMPSMQMALENGQIDEISTYTCVADYIVARNSKFEILEGHNPINFANYFCFVVRDSDLEIKHDIDTALEEMKTDGTLENLKKTYIDDLKGTEDPPAVAFETFDGADTITVAVTGDLPPLDLILADGTPAGFNTAVLSEVGKRLQKNIEIVQIETGSRLEALATGKIEVVFWAIVPVDDNIPADIDKPQGVEFSTPYFQDKFVHIGLKK